MDDILKRFSVEKDLFEKKIRGCKETTKMEVFENCFLRKGKRVETFVKILS
jgi:hypothetical protein